MLGGKRKKISVPGADVRLSPGVTQAVRRGSQFASSLISSLPGRKPRRRLGRGTVVVLVGAGGLTVLSFGLLGLLAALVDQIGLSPKSPTPASPARD